MYGYDYFEIHRKASKARAEAIAEIIHGIGQWLRKRAENRKTAEQLYSMSDRELADIGIVRGDIPSALKGRRCGDDYRNHICDVKEAA